MLTQRQLEITNGSLLGDGTIWTNFIDPLCKFQMTQSKLDNGDYDKKSYMLWYISEFIDFGCSIRFKEYAASGIVKQMYGDKIYQKYIFTTRCHELWNQIEKQWYIPRVHDYWRRRKIVPVDLKLTPLTLCVWHMDDGSNETQEANITLNTQGFTLFEVDFLIERLKQDLNIKATKKKTKKEDQFRIYVGRNSYFDYIDLIKPHVQWDCFKYKIDDTTYNKVEQVGGNHSQAKLNEVDAQEIFSLREQGWLHREIANKFKVSQANITQILNGKRWAHLNKCISPRTVKRISKDQKEQITIMLGKGISQKVIADELGVNQSTISRIGATCLE